MSITLDSQKLKTIIKESLKEVLTLEMMKLRADLLLNVSEKEQREVEKLYGKPKRRVAKSLVARV